MPTFEKTVDKFFSKGLIISSGAMITYMMLYNKDNPKTQESSNKKNLYFNKELFFDCVNENPNVDQKDCDRICENLKEALNNSQN
tara:strand:+ start:709 stop:963 length:255 start_codon:yes stop_codon:yes gene_type:complete